jgi:nucleotide-binding universal stress UspA family protein
MQNTLLHIYRNTPFGRETLLQSMFFSRRLGLGLSVYIPETPKFLMYFDPHTVQVDLDASYLKDRASARRRVEELLAETGTEASFFRPAEYTASNLPDIPTQFGFMTCPRVISELSSTIRLGRIGSKVRAILRRATFPVLIPSHAFKEWQSVCVMFGGSINGVKALQLGLQVARRSEVPLDVFTQAEGGRRRTDYEQVVRERNLEHDFANRVRHWHFRQEGELSSNLFSVPHDALVVLGIFGHGVIKDIMFGNTAEAAQSTLPNTLLLVGPGFKYHRWYFA